MFIVCDFVGGCLCVCVEGPYGYCLVVYTLLCCMLLCGVCAHVYRVCICIVCLCMSMCVVLIVQVYVYRVCFVSVCVF